MPHLVSAEDQAVEAQVILVAPVGVRVGEVGRDGKAVRGLQVPEDARAAARDDDVPSASQVGRLDDPRLVAVGGDGGLASCRPQEE